MAKYEFDRKKYRNVVAEAFISYLRSLDIHFMFRGVSAISRYCNVPYKCYDFDIQIETDEDYAASRIIKGFIDSPEHIQLLEDEEISEDAAFEVSDEEAEYCTAEFGEEYRTYFAIDIVINPEFPCGYLDAGGECVYSLATYLDDAFDFCDCCDPRLHNLFPLFYALDTYQDQVPDKIKKEWIAGRDFGEEWSEAIEGDFISFFYDAGIALKVRELMDAGEMKSSDDFVQYMQTLQTDLTSWLNRVICSYGGVLDYEYVIEDENEDYLRELYANIKDINFTA